MTKIRLLIAFIAVLSTVAVAGTIDFNSATINGTLPLSKLRQEGATIGQLIGWNGTNWTPTTISTGISIGTTAIAGGNDGYLLKNNNGIVDEVTLNAYGATLIGLNTVDELKASIGLLNGAFSEYGTDEFQLLRWAANSNSQPVTQAVMTTDLGAIKRGTLPEAAGGTGATTFLNAAKNLIGAVPGWTDGAYLTMSGADVVWTVPVVNYSGSFIVQSALGSGFGTTLYADDPIMGSGVYSTNNAGDSAYLQFPVLTTGNTFVYQLPDASGTVLLSSSSLPAANLTGTIDIARLSGITASQLSASAGIADTQLAIADGAFSAAKILNTAAVLTGNAFTGANSVTLTGIGTSTSAGLSLINSTAATSGTQQNSPSLILQGQGWKTNATAGSQSTAWEIYTTPVVGSTAPSEVLNIRRLINGSADVPNTGYPTLQIGGTAYSPTLSLNGGYSTDLQVAITSGNYTKLGVSSGAIVLSTGGLEEFAVWAGDARIKSTTRLGFSNGGSIPSGTLDTVVVRDAAGVWAHKLAGRQQKIRVYDSTPTNYIEVTHDGTDGVISTNSGAVRVSSNLKLDTAKTLSFTSGTNQIAGDTTLVAGTVTVSNTAVTANTKVIFNRKTAGGDIGNLTYTISAGASFTINSDSATDTSTVSYLLIEVP